MNIGSTTIPETLRDGRYTIGKVLGQGGMAVVTIAHDAELGVDRAVKLLMASGHHRASLRRRLKAEARAMARLNHPNILSIHDVGIEGELDYVVMDLATGGSLQDVLADNGPLRPSLAIQYMIQALSALAAAHAAGIVHRDVKPHNILLDAQGRVMLADFGIALLTGDDRRTKSGVAMGSLAFMPPEQRLDAAKVGPSADIYACGSTLFNLLTGENPVDLFLASERSPRWENVPEALRGLIRRACLMEPDERWATAGDMAYALLEVLRADAGGFSTAEGPFGPTFPEPSVGFSKHTTGTDVPPATILPATASSATAHAVEALEKVAPPPVDPLGEHQPTVTSHETTPASEVVLDAHATWAPTIQTDGPIATPTPDRRAWFATAGAALVVLLFLGAWWFLASTRLPNEPEPQPPTTQTAPETEPAPEPVPTEPSPEPTPEEPEPSPTPVAPSRPQPTVAPAPTEVAPPPPTPAPVQASRVAGSWEGTMGGAFVDLQLEGSDGMLRGTMSTFIGSRVSRQAVRGTFDAEQATVALRETEARPPARFELTLQQGRLVGSVVKATGARGPLELGRP